jgi:hypothetical protein
MAQQPLHKADIDAALDQQRRRRMPQHMRRDAARDSRPRRIAAQLRSHRLRLHRHPAPVQEQIAARTAVAPVPLSQPFQIGPQFDIGDVGHPVARVVIDLAELC